MVPFAACRFCHPGEPLVLPKEQLPNLNQYLEICLRLKEALAEKEKETPSSPVFTFNLTVKCPQCGNLNEFEGEDLVRLWAVIQNLILIKETTEPTPSPWSGCGAMC